MSTQVRVNDCKAIEIPEPFRNTPIVELVKHYSSEVTKLFVEKVIKAISLEEFAEVSEWSGWNNEEIREDSKKVLRNKVTRDLCDLELLALINAILVRKVLQARYPKSAVCYNDECIPIQTLWYVSKSWIKIGGVDGAIVDCNGGLINLNQYLWMFDLKK